MLEDLLDYLRQGEGPLAYGVLGAAAAIEYVFPPFPGDTIVLFGAFLAATAGYHPLIVYAALTGGSMVGASGTYFGGRWIAANRTRLPRFLQTDQARWAFDRLDEQFQRYGAAYLAVNRFLPAMRAFFFIGAGMARMPFGRVLFFGGLSAAAWNALLLAVGYGVGANWEYLQRIFGRYSAVVAVLVALVVATLAIRWWIRVSRSRRAKGRGGDR
jgi:membrane protein DedA with SNARE-associated domain